MCHKIIKALPKIYFALKKDTPQGYNANNLLLHNARWNMHECIMHECIMHECNMCNKMIKALSKIYFALKKDTLQGYKANNLFLHNALCMMQYASCIMHYA